VLATSNGGLGTSIAFPFRDLISGKFGAVQCTLGGRAVSQSTRMPQSVGSRLSCSRMFLSLGSIVADADAVCLDVNKAPAYALKHSAIAIAHSPRARPS
jgi:hypothetical protein